MTLLKVNASNNCRELLKPNPRILIKLINGFFKFANHILPLRDNTLKVALHKLYREITIGESIF